MSDLNLQSALMGGWTVKGPLDKEAKEVFDKALDGLVGVGYEPLLYATQTVNGTNYCVITKYRVVVPNAPEGFASIIFNVAPGGEISRPQIKRII